MNISTTMGALGIDKENFRTLGLLPLVFVAWADGAVQRAEESLIRRVAREKGWLVGTGESILEDWLKRPPPAEYVQQGLSLIKQLASSRHGFAGAITDETLSSLLVMCKDVAEAAGGLWGFAESISAEEELALATIAEAFGIGDSGTWRRIVSAAEAQADDRPEVPGPKGHILVGELPAISRDPLALFMRSFNEYGDVVRLRMPGGEWYLISHPDHVKHVLVDQARNYVRGASYDRFRLIFGSSIVTTDGEQWRPLRRAAQPAFHHGSVGRMASMMVECATDMLDRWRARPDCEASLDLASNMHRLTLRIIGLAMFSVDLEGEDARELCESVEDALEYANGTTNPFRMPVAVPTRTNRRFSKAMKRFETFVLNTLAQRQESGEHPHDLMSMLLKTVDPETNDELSHAQIRNEMLTYLVAGHETTATTLTWMAYMLSKHPIVARRLQDELDEVLGGELPTLEVLDRLPYLHRVIQETMRLYPAAFMLPREVVSEDRLGDYTIPAKSWVLLSPYVTHRRPELWPNPQGFDPDRFLPEEVAKRPNHAYFPFFAGPHKCIGQGMAMMEMKLLAATIFTRCRLDLLAGFEPTVDAQVALRTQDGMMMHPRWSSPDAADEA